MSIDLEAIARKHGCTDARTMAALRDVRDRYASELDTLRRALTAQEAHNEDVAQALAEACEDIERLTKALRATGVAA